MRNQITVTFLLFTQWEYIIHYLCTLIIRFFFNFSLKSYFIIQLSFDYSQMLCK